MKSKDKKYVKNKCEDEGFDYTFIYYSKFADINDEEFHRLRKEYIEAHNKLAKYLGIDY